MNSKITLPRLVSALAEKSGLPRKNCDEFMREFAALVVATLEKGESVKVRGLGSFRLGTVQPRKSVDVTTGEEIEIAGHTRVNFTPTRELAAAVNAPFECFESVILPEDISETDLAIAATAPIAEPSETQKQSEAQKQSVLHEEQEASEEDIPAEDSAHSTALPTTPPLQDGQVVQDTSEVASAVVESPAESCEEREVLLPDTIAISMETPIESGVEYAETTDLPGDRNDESPALPTQEPKGKRHNFVTGFLIGFICCAAAAALVIWLWKPSQQSEGETPLYEQAENDGTSGTDMTDGEDNPVDYLQDITDGDVTDGELAEAVATLPSDQDANDKGEAIIDTITRTRYLTTMAKEHYGNFNLWPYIYMENSSKLGHPDRIRPGTPVIVPPLSKYGVNPSDPAAIRKAKEIGLEIYAKYK